MVRTLALITGLGCVVLGVLCYRGTLAKATLSAQLAALRTANQRHLAEVEEAGKTRQRLEQQLLELDADLGATKTKLTETESTKVQIARELTAARNELRQLTEEHGRLRAESVQLRQKLAEPPSAPADVIVHYETTIARLKEELAAREQPPAPVLSTTRARSTVVVSIGPADAFVVINYGADHGALPAQKLLIRRGTEIMGVALISDVRDQYSIAQVDPQSLRGALHKGDSAIIAN